MIDSPAGGDGHAVSESEVVKPNEGPHGLFASISREMVGLYKEQFGRGPTKARTAFAGPDCLVCTLEETLTPAERNLAEMGEHQRLRDVRLYFQHATEAKFVEIVERLTGRKVRGFISGMDTHKDIAAEIFYLEPAPDGDPGSRSLADLA
jgi:uncharacterized protein YbcI